MAVGSDNFLHLARPLAPGHLMAHSTIAALAVNIAPSAIVSILDHTNRHVSSTPSSRAIGALVGSRSEDGTEVTVTSTFAIPHTETEDQVEVDVEYQRAMLAMTLKASPRETLLGWYTTSPELNSFSALIQNFFASPETGTYPHPAVHMTLDATAGANISPTCYISAPVAANAERAGETCFFIEVPSKITVNENERSALEMVSSALQSTSLNNTTPIVSDITALRTTLNTTIDLLDRIGDYVGSVMDVEREPNHALGQYLMNALSLAPKVESADIERDFNNHIQDVLMVSYLANTIKTQIDLSQKLAVSCLVGEKDDKTDGQGDKGGQRGAKRQGRGGRQGGGGGGGNREPREQE